MPIEEYGSIDFPVALDEWEDYIIAFRENLGTETYPEPDIAVFWLDKATQLRVRRSGKSLVPGVPSFVEVPSAELVEYFYNLMPQGNQGRKAYYISKSAIRDGKVVILPIRIAELKFKKDQLVERTGGVIHNPPY
ncbi:hypothetical protein [Hymenobacter sp. HDW8]|uniref:hypothetical protein n=1 Tax=Hymenobacter sp. HDW8 TaxID=2714932 RepID=UPI00140A2375|nr:hypothetical protein [Hymenobacter sp. HDW8]QIL77673.1 hypothetical protein G7064_18885 [Hymenobacter sp. HDW8]